MTSVEEVIRFYGFRILESSATPITETTCLVSYLVRYEHGRTHNEPVSLLVAEMMRLGWRVGKTTSKIDDNGHRIYKIDIHADQVVQDHETKPKKKSRPKPKLHRFIGKYYKIIVALLILVIYLYWA